jgi:hypothetical protein
MNFMKSVYFTTLAVVLLMLMFATFAAFAEGPVYIDEVPMGCDNPTTRTDGTALDPSEIDRVLFFISDTVTDLPPPADFSPAHTEIMTGGCADRVLPTGSLTPGKQYYKLAVTYDTGARVSSYSDFFPFTTDLAPPNAPVVR